MSHHLGWQEEWLGGRSDRDEPTFDLVRSKPHPRARANGLVWRAPSQIAQLRSEEAAAAPETPRGSRARISDAEVDALAAELGVRRPRRVRQRVVQFLGALLLAACIWAGFKMI